MKKLLRFIGIAFLLWMSYFVYSMSTAQERVTTLCQAIQPGMSVAELRAYAADHDLGARHFKDQATLVYLAESRSFGRHACRIELANGQVTRSSYNFAD